MKQAISLFSGLGGDSLGMKNAGLTVVAYSEKNAIFCESHDKNFPDCEYLHTNVTTSCKNGKKGQTKDIKEGDISKLPDEVFSKYKGKIEVLFAGFPCFVEGTQVLTHNGYKPIETVTHEDLLLTHKGRFNPIVNLQRKKYLDELYEIDIMFHTNNIICTKEHPFYVRKRIQSWNSNMKKYQYTFEDPVWKAASELTMNDYFGMVINENEIIPEFTFIKKINTNKRECITIHLNDIDMWFMMGYFVGDGWVEDTKKPNGSCMNKIRFAINNTDECFILNKITKFLPVTDKHCDTGKCKKFGCSDFAWYELLKQFGKYAHVKLIPEWVHNAPKIFIQEFINGYMKAYGNILLDERHRTTTVSYNLATGLQRLYLKLGHIASINKTVRDETCTIDGRVVNQRDTYNIEVLLEKKRKMSSFIEDNYVWFPLKSISQKSVSEPIFVYNFEVENDNSYIVENTVVHNCQGFSNAGKKLENDPRNTLFKEFVRATRLIQPNYIVGENVKGLLSRKIGVEEADTDEIKDTKTKDTKTKEKPKSKAKKVKKSSNHDNEDNEDEDDENVIVSSEESDNKNRYIDIIEKEFVDLGYNIKYKVLKTDKYGVPQKRERLIIIGVRKELNKVIDFPSEETNIPNLIGIVKFSMEGAMKINKEQFDFDTIPAECILEDMSNEENENTPHPYLKSKVNNVSQTYKNKDYEGSLISFGKRDSPLHCEIVDIRNPSKTIICTYEHQPRLFVPLKNKNGYFLRCLLPDELKQIQGFPSDYIVCGSKKDQIIQIGNAVPPPLIEKVVKKMIE
jgi:site-specific DNA-cytosine methylase